MLMTKNIGLKLKKLYCKTYQANWATLELMNNINII